MLISQSQRRDRLMTFIVYMVSASGVLISLWYVGDTTSDGDEWHDPMWHPTYMVFYGCMLAGWLVGMVVFAVRVMKDD